MPRPDVALRYGPSRVEPPAASNYGATIRGAPDGVPAGAGDASGVTVTPTPHRAAPRSSRWPAALFLSVVAILVVYLLVHYDVVGSTNQGAGVGSGHAASQTRSVGAFTGVELAGGNVVTISVGKPRSVVVRADDNLIGRITTAVHGGRLVIGNTSGSFASKAPTSVSVTTPSLDELVLSGSGTVEISGIRTAHLTLAIPGSGVVRASGTAGRLDVAIPGSGTAQLAPLVARAVHASVDGSGAIVVTATQSLDARVSGSGAISYAGNPSQVTTSVTGSGVVIPLR